MKLDLGAGSRPQEGFTGVDRYPCTPETIVFDLVTGMRWPFEDDSIEELTSSHFIEHIPADNVLTHKKRGIEVLRVEQDRLFFFFDQAYRIIRPGGLFHLVWPALKSSDAFRDPTHRRFIPIEFAWYLARQGRELMGLQHYEVDCNWVVVEESVRLHVEPPPEGQQWSTYSTNRLWDVQKSCSLTLKAEK